MKTIITLVLLLAVACSIAPTKREPIEYKIAPVNDSVPFNPEGYTLEGEFQDDTIGQPKS